MKHLILILLLGLGMFFSPLTEIRGQCNDSLVFGTSLPVPLDQNNKNHLNDLNESLQRIKSKFPFVKLLFIPFFIESTDSGDWLGVLDIVAQNDMKAIVAFYDSTANEAFRPTPSGPGQWNLGKLGDFISCDSCVSHPALSSIAMIDEPFEVMNTIILHDLYKTCKNLNPSRQYKIMVNHSRQIWKKVHVSQGGIGTNPNIYWRDSLCDMVNISSLEFRRGTFDVNTLLENHSTSRKIIATYTPDLPVYTTVQTFGSSYSGTNPNANYYFPSGDELYAMLDLVTSPELQSIKPLTGIVFQNWSRKFSAQNQWTLGSEDKEGSPLSRHEAGSNLIDTINYWLEPCLEISTAAKVENLRYSIYPNPFSQDLFIEIPIPEAKVFITDVFGRLVGIYLLSEKVNMISSGSLSPGIYFMTIKNGNQSTTKIIIKQ